MRLPRRRRTWLLAALPLVAAAIALPLVLLGGGSRHLVPRAHIGDPLAYRPGHDAELERTAAFGLSHVLYAKSPDGAIATARRVARFRPLVDAAVSRTGVDPATLEAIVYLESAGRPDAIAGSDPAAASGLTQIVAETGIDFLRMPIDLTESRRLTRLIDRATANRHFVRAARLRAARRAFDPRFDPVQALGGAVRYLQTARARLGRPDLAVVSYHMGIGNLEAVERAYGRSRVAYAQLYFDSSPLSHPEAWARLAALGDDSRDYLWRVLAAKEIMRLYRKDLPRLRRLAALQAHAPSAERVLHPDPPRTTRGLQPLPDAPARLHFRLDPRIEKRDRRLRPEALALLVYLTSRVARISRASTPLLVTSALGGDSADAAGYGFRVLRRYATPAQAAAFQFELERLQALGLIAWAREPTRIHVTVAAAARVLVPAVLRLSG